MKVIGRQYANESGHLIGKDEYIVASRAEAEKLIKREKKWDEKALTSTYVVYSIEE